MSLHLDIIPEKIIESYNLQVLATDGWVYIEIQKGTYGLPQAGILANKLIIKRLHTDGYFSFQFMPGLWWHLWRLVKSVLVVDDYGIKYKGLKHANHVVETLKKYYEVSIDWGGTLFCGITIKLGLSQAHITIIHVMIH